MNVIKVENLGKKYIISHQRERSGNYINLREVIFEKMGNLSRKLFNPFTRNETSQHSAHEEFWALRDVSFEIKQGERVGIIGRNGAGKSTLLKILSRITEPTTGRVSINGRIASLLEVGTGFHPELTGRENIYLNGAILGMVKAEIKKKFDEIVDFSGVEKFLDTPVKHFSSGMYVRLAFAVAAHLEPEILIIDEVLAVGDAEFQKKCLGKMQDASKSEGRTVLFVSHNMETIIKLCNRCVYLKNGKVELIDSTTAVINNYLKTKSEQKEIINVAEIQRPKGAILTENAKFISARMCNTIEPWKIKYRQALFFQFEIEVYTEIDELEIGVAISTVLDFEIISSLSSDNTRIQNLKKGIYKVDFSFNEFYLLPATYRIGLGIRSNKGFEDYIPIIGNFEVLISEESANDKTSTRKGIVVPKILCSISEVK